MIQEKTCYRFSKAALTLLTAALCSISLQARAADSENERITSAQIPMTSEASNICVVRSIYFIFRVA